MTFSFLTFPILLYILSFSWRDASAHLSECPLYGVETVYIDRDIESGQVYCGTEDKTDIYFAFTFFPSLTPM